MRYGAIALAVLFLFGCGGDKKKTPKVRAGGGGAPTLLTSGQRAKEVVKKESKTKKEMPSYMMIPPFNPNARTLPPEAFVEQGKENRDPFRNFNVEVAENPSSETLEAEDEGVVLLERYDLSQLTLTGIVWAAGREKALIRDPEGQPTVIHKGDIISKSRAWVKEITHDRVILAIPTGDPEQKEKIVEMKLHGMEEAVPYQIQYEKLRADQRGIRIRKRRPASKKRTKNSGRRNEP